MMHPEILRRLKAQQAAAAAAETVRVQPFPARDSRPSALGTEAPPDTDALIRAVPALDEMRDRIGTVARQLYAERESANSYVAACESETERVREELAASRSEHEDTMRELAAVREELASVTNERDALLERVTQ